MIILSIENVAVPERMMELISNQLNAGSSPVSDAIRSYVQKIYIRAVRVIC